MRHYWKEWYLKVPTKEEFEYRNESKLIAQFGTFRLSEVSQNKFLLNLILLH